MIPLGVLIVNLFYFPQSKKLFVAMHVFRLHAGESGARHGLNYMLFSAENADGCNNTL